MYNDLGFLAGNRLVVLVEAQSSWSENIVVRFLVYLGETYRRYIEKNDLDLYTTKKVELPKPELYVIYTGDRKERPEKISLKKSFFGTDDCCVEVEATVIYDNCPGDIINQFIVFSKVFDGQRKLYPDDKRKSVQETIRICREKGVLTSYLEQEEEAAVMFTFADQEQEFNRALRKEREYGELAGEIRGTIKLYDDEMGMSPSEIIPRIMDRFSLTRESAEQYVESTLNLQHDPAGNHVSGCLRMQEPLPSSRRCTHG
jgi:hypothetical protein